MAKNVSENIQEMPESRSTVFSSDQKKVGWGTNNRKTNDKYLTKDAHSNREIPLEQNKNLIFTEK